MLYDKPFYGNNKLGDFMIAVLFRTVILYIFVVIALRLMGKRQIGDMQPGELVITLLISEIAAIPLQDINQPIASGIIAIFMLVIMEILLSFLAMKSFFIRKALSGRSAVVIKNGEIDQNAMRRVRMTVIDLIELLRGQNVFDISTVAYAVLEVNGSLSVLLKGSERAATAADIGAAPQPDGLPLPVISDGKFVDEALQSLQLSRKDIEAILRQAGTAAGEVFMMTVDRFGNKNIIIKRKERTK